MVANLAVGVSYLPWLGGLREDLHAPNYIAGFTPLTLPTLRYIGETFWIGHPLTPIALLPGNLIVALAGAGLVIAVIGLAVKVRGTGRTIWRPTSRIVLVVLLAVAPAALVILYSWIRVDILGGSYIIASWPGMAVAIGVLVTSPPKPWRWAAIALTLVAYAVGGIMMLGSTAQSPNINAAVAYIDRIGVNGDPIVSAPYFANPVSELDIGLADAGQVQHHPVLRLGTPPLSEQLAHLSGPHPQPVFSGLPVTAPQVVAQRTVALARHGTIFFVSENGPVPALLKYFPNSPISLFYRALPPRFHVVQHMTFSGFSGLEPVSVYVIRDTRSVAQP